MKKIKTVLFLAIGLCLTLNTSMAYALDNNNGSTSANQKTMGQKIEKVQEKVQTGKQWAQELKPLFDQVRTNKVEILKLRGQLESTRGQINAKINELRQQKDTLNDEQIARLKECLQVLKDDKTDIKGLLGDTRQDISNLRAGKKSQDIEQAKASLENIIKAQQERIDLLNKTIDDMQKVLAV